MNFSRLSKIKTQNIENNSNISSILTYKNNNQDNNNSEYNKIQNNKNIIEEKDILLKTDNYTFEIKYNKMKSGNEYFTIFNNKNMYCIRIKKDIENTDEIYLQHLNFFESCSKNKSLMRKNGTIEMLLSILQYIRDFYNKDLKYFFQDNSSITIYENKLKLNLIYVLLYGKTWYMKNINAMPYDKNFLSNLEIINEYLENNKDNITYFFKESIEKINNNNIYETIISKDFMNIISKNNTEITKKQIWKDIKNIYTSSLNSREFLQLLYKRYGMIIFILLNYYEYFEYIVIYKIKYSLDFNTLMVIPTDFINNINIIR